MRSPALATLALASLAVAALGRSTAAAEPLWRTELRAGYGIAASGGGAGMSRRATPLTVSAIVSFAFNEEPPLWGYGGVTAETLDRNAAGAVFGVELRPRGSRLRLAGGGTTLVAPYTLWGVTASVGACLHVTRRMGLCGDGQLTAYIAGTDLADGALNQAQFVVGVVFDVP